MRPIVLSLGLILVVCSLAPARAQAPKPFSPRGFVIGDALVTADSTGRIIVALDEIQLDSLHDSDGVIDMVFLFTPGPGKGVRRLDHKLPIQVSRAVAFYTDAGLMLISRAGHILVDLSIEAPRPALVPRPTSLGISNYNGIALARYSDKAVQIPMQLISEEPSVLDDILRSSFLKSTPGCAAGGVGSSGCTYAWVGGGSCGVTCASGYYACCNQNSCTCKGGWICEEGCLE